MIPYWLSRTELLLGDEPVKSLMSKHVLVVGLGGVGGICSEMIARAGVGRMTIVDGDKVDLSNCNRQIPALHSTAGKPKADIMAERLKDINPDINLTVIREHIEGERIREILTAGDYDFVVDCIDTLSPKVAFLQCCVELALPVVSSLGAGGKVDPLQVTITEIENTHMVKYSVSHFADFYRGMYHLAELLEDLDLPPSIKFYTDRISRVLKETPLQKLAQTEPGEKSSVRLNLYFGYHLRGRYKSDTLELIDIFSRLDAWYSMAVAVKTYGLSFPEFVEQKTPLVDAKKLYHVLLPEPVAYDLQMDPANNFLFLTGANMAGKSTLIKALGSAVFLAHIGMGVPAREMKLTLFDGLLSNINVVDNIAKGESFFFNEVQRIKNTIEKINDGKKWLVLIDELFKGTNVQDAMKCSLAVIRGLIKIQNSLFILSTHLYEIGEQLKEYPNISFRYFETIVKDEQLEFSYQLREGISNDRIGYVILKREKVVEMLEKL